MIGPESELQYYACLNIVQFALQILAVDCAFKLFHTTHATYTVQCEMTWMFFQKVIYKINTKWKLNFPNTYSVSADIFEDIYKIFKNLLKMLCYICTRITFIFFLIHICHILIIFCV